MKKLHIILFISGLAFLGVLIWKSGARELGRQLRYLGWKLIPIILAEGVAELCHAVSWRYCLSGPHRKIELLRLFQIHLAGYAVNFLTPTASVAGDVTKAAFLSSNAKGPEGVSAVLIGKLSFALGHLLLVAVGTVFLLPHLEFSPNLRTALLISSSVLAIGIIGFLLFQKMGKLGGLVRWTAGIFRAKALQRFVEEIDRVDEVLKAFYRDHPWDLWISVLWHLLGYSVAIFTTWYFLFVSTQAPGFSVAAGIWFLALWFDLVTFAVPLSLGVLEGGRIVAFRAFGYKALPGMVFGIVTRLAQLFWAGIGLLNYALLITTTGAERKRDPREGSLAADERLGA